jgi:hypothetical protein
MQKYIWASTIERMIAAGDEGDAALIIPWMLCPHPTYTILPLRETAFPGPLRKTFF